MIDPIQCSDGLWMKTSNNLNPSRGELINQSQGARSSSTSNLTSRAKGMYNTCMQGFGLMVVTSWKV